MSWAVGCGFRWAPSVMGSGMWIAVGPSVMGSGMWIVVGPSVMGSGMWIAVGPNVMGMIRVGSPVCVRRG